MNTNCTLVFLSSLVLHFLSPNQEIEKTPSNWIFLFPKYHQSSLRSQSFYLLGNNQYKLKRPFISTSWSLSFKWLTSWHPVHHDGSPEDSIHLNGCLIDLWDLRKYSCYFQQFIWWWISLCKQFIHNCKGLLYRITTDESCFVLNFSGNQVIWTKFNSYRISDRGLYKVMKQSSKTLGKQQRNVFRCCTISYSGKYTKLYKKISKNK